MAGTYAKVIPDVATTHRIAAILDLFNIENAAAPCDLHVTVVYSKQECASVKDISVPTPIKASGASLQLFPNADGSKCLVVELDSPALQELHWLCRNEHNASHDYPTYRPHITLSYDYSGEIIPNSSLLGHFHTLYFNQYVVEPLNVDWESY
jgi:2'-5' RNA ligase